MRKWIAALILTLLVAANCQACLTGWLMGTPTELDNPQAEFLARIGIQMEDPAEIGETDIGWPEVGVQVDWVSTDGDYARYGVYGLLHLNEGNPDSWLGQFYLGYAATLAVSGSEDGMSSYGPVIGTVYGKIFAIEYQYRSYEGPLSAEMQDWSDEHKVYAGLCLRY